MKRWWMSLFVGAGLILSSCGNNNNNNIPVNTNPYYNYGGTGVNCGAYGQGTPLSPSNTPYVANLGNGLGLSLNLFYTQGFSADVPQQNITAYGTLAATVNGQAMNIQVCSTTPGYYSYQTISLTLQGSYQMPYTTQYPSYNPYSNPYSYNPYSYNNPYGTNTAQTVIIQVGGNQGQAYLSYGRISGFVSVNGSATYAQ